MVYPDAAMTANTTSRTSKQNERFRVLKDAIAGEPAAIDRLSLIRPLETVALGSCNNRQTVWNGTDGGDGLLYAVLTLVPRSISVTKFFAWVTDVGTSPSLGKVSFAAYDTSGNLVVGATSDVDPVDGTGGLVLSPEDDIELEPGLYYIAISTNVSGMRCLKARNGWTGVGPAVGVLVTQPFVTEPETGLPSTILLNNKANLRLWIGAIE